MMTVAYLLSYILTLLCIGGTFFVLAPGDRTEKRAAALMGFALVPLFITLSCMLAVFLLPGHITVLRWSPAVFAVLLLSLVLHSRKPGWVRFPVSYSALNHKTLKQLVTQPYQHVRALPVLEKRMVFGWMLVALAFFVVILKFFTILAQNTFPAIANDALTYLSEALYFIKNLKLSSFYYGQGSALEGLPPTHPHTFTFSLYLAHALSFANFPAPGLPEDMAARIAFQLSVFSLLCGVVATALLTAPKKASPLLVGLGAVFAFLLFPVFEYMSFSSSRDAYRLVPWLLLVTMLTRLTAAKTWSWTLLAMTASAASLTLAVHAIHAYFLVVASLVFLPFVLLRKTSGKDWFRLIVAGTVICALPVLHYVMAWLKYGSPLGLGMNYFHFKDTPLMEVFQSHRQWGGSQMGFWQALDSVMARHGSLFGRLLPVMAIILAGLLVWRKQARHYPAALFVALLFLACLVIPVSNILRFLPIDMKEAYLSNFRYVYTAYILAPLVLVHLSVIFLGSSWCIARQSHLRFALFVPLLILAGFSYHYLEKWRTYPNYRAATAYIEDSRTACAPLASLEKDAVWLSDSATISYYCNRIPSFLYSPFGRQFFAAKNEAKIIALLKQHKVRLITLKAGNIAKWWPVTQFYRTLLKQEKAGKIRLKKTRYWYQFTLSPETG